jgi:hypothetical protein
VAARLQKTPVRGWILRQNCALNVFPISGRQTELRGSGKKELEII